MRAALVREQALARVEESRRLKAIGLHGSHGQIGLDVLHDTTEIVIDESQFDQELWDAALEAKLQNPGRARLLEPGSTYTLADAHAISVDPVDYGEHSAWADDPISDTPTALEYLLTLTILLFLAGCAAALILGPFRQIERAIGYGPMPTEIGAMR